MNVIITCAKEKNYNCNSVPEDFFLQYKETLEQEKSNNLKAVFYAYLTYCKAVSDQNETQRMKILQVLNQFGQISTNQLQRDSTVFAEEISNRMKTRLSEFNKTL